MQIQTRTQCGKCGKPTAHNLIDFVMDKAIVECRECLCVSMRSRREVFQDSERRTNPGRQRERALYHLALL